MRSLLWWLALGGLLGPAAVGGREDTERSAPAVVRGTVLVANSPAAGAVVYLDSPASAPPASADTVVMDQVGLRFVPRLLVVPPATTVEFRNSDAVLHNIFGPGRPGAPFDLGTYSAPETRYETFEETGAHVILCNIHPEMSAYVLVAPTEHFAVADENGRFEIDEVPPGQYRLGVWHRWSVPHEEPVSLADRLDLQIRLTPR